MIQTAIKEYIQQKGIKLTHISNETNIKSDRLSRILNRENSPIRADEYVSICRALDVPLDKFVCDSKKEPKQKGDDTNG